MYVCVCLWVREYPSLSLCDIHIHVMYAQGYVQTQNAYTRAHEYCYCTKDPICVRAVACVCETCDTGFSISGVTCQTSLETVLFRVSSWIPSHCPGFQRAQQYGGKPSYISIDGTRFVYYLEGFEQWLGRTLGSTLVSACMFFNNAELSNVFEQHRVDAIAQS